MTQLSLPVMVEMMRMKMNVFKR